VLAGTIIGIIPILIVVFVIVEPERSPRTSLDWVASFVHKEKTRPCNDHRQKSPGTRLMAPTA
jgi:hypothetical protein